MYLVFFRHNAIAHLIDYTINSIADSIVQYSIQYNVQYSIVYFWLHWVFVAARGLSLVAASGGYSWLQCVGFSLRWLLLLRSMGSRRAGFSSCGMLAQQLWLVGSRAEAQLLWRTGLVAPQLVGSSQTRARTRVPCIGRQILNHCATREVPKHNFLYALENQKIHDSLCCSGVELKPQYT